MRNSVRRVGMALWLAGGVAVAVAVDPTVAASQRPSLESVVDSIVMAEGMDRSVPGLGVAIIAGGEVAYQRAYGFADLETRSVATVATPFNVASVTKPFTSAVVMQLVEEGAVGLRDPVRRHLAWLPERYRDITVYQLLTHTSGIARDLRTDNFDDPDARTYRARLDTASASARPGERFEYSNTGYTVLGWLVEAVEGRPLAEVLRDRIFDPLGMGQARYRATLEEDPLRARPHDVSDGEPGGIGYITGGFGSGGMSMSVADAVAFGLALQRGEFLPAPAADSVWTPARLADGTPVALEMFGSPAAYGFGWFLTEYSGRRMLTHGGGIEGYSANLYHFPREELTIVVLSNTKRRDDGRAPVDPLARRLADACLELDGCRPPPETSHLRTEIGAANRSFSRAFVAGDTAAIRAMYTRDALALLPNPLLVTGADDIAGLFDPLARGRRLAHGLYTERLTRHGDVVTEAGTWYERSTAGEGTGRYALTWVRIGDRWRVAVDAWGASSGR